ncbi:hypothetical protein F2Q69_00006781 [Brassica cretica]|uniref:Uncharacterized protein n=1 Tax=Brassica cretica TaxID=69181 RepID=A0A8S9NUX1_BRACR|nr:hypothetical protein F2Q69_00006781 [Brassica cretica]
MHRPLGLETGPTSKTSPGSTTRKPEPELSSKGPGFYDEQKKQRGNSPQGGKDPIRSLRCGEQAPTGCMIAKGHTSWIRSPETSDHGQPLQKWHDLRARSQKIKTGMRHKAGVGMRKPEEQSKSCFSRHGKQRKPDTWVITPTPAPSKPGSKDKKEARTPVQPKAHRGHNKLQRTSGFQSAISGSKPPGSNTSSEV